MRNFQTSDFAIKLVCFTVNIANRILLAMYDIRACRGYLATNYTTATACCSTFEYVVYQTLHYILLYLMIYRRDGIFVVLTK